MLTGKTKWLVYPVILLVVWSAAMAMNFAATTVDVDVMRNRVGVMVSQPVSRSMAQAYQHPFETCQIALTVMATAEYGPGGALLDRLALRWVYGRDERYRGIASSVFNYCPELVLAMSRAGWESRIHGDWYILSFETTARQLHMTFFKPRYAVQHISLHALLLRMMPHNEVALLVMFATYSGILALLVGAARLGGRVYLAGAPVCASVAAWSSIYLWNGPGNGITFMLAVWALAAAAFLLRWRGPGVGPPAFFAIGAALQFFWFMDSHQILVLTMVSLMGYFALAPERPWRQAGLWCGAYLAGSGVNFVLGYPFRYWLLLRDTERGWLDAAIGVFPNRIEHYQRLQEPQSILATILPVNDVAVFAATMAEESALVMFLTAVFAVAAATVGWVVLRRQRIVVRRSDLYVVGLMLLLCLVQLIAPEDNPKRITRYVSVPAGLLLSMALLCAWWEFQAWRDRRTDGTARRKSRPAQEEELNPEDV